MKNSAQILPLPLTALAAVALSLAALPALAEDKPDAVEVHIDGGAHIVAPAWESGRDYKYGEFVSYGGFAFRAKGGSSHRRPNPDIEAGWELMNACDDTSKKAIECEEENQVETGKDKNHKGDSDWQFERSQEAEHVLSSGKL